MRFNAHLASLRGDSIGGSLKGSIARKGRPLSQQLEAAVQCGVEQLESRLMLAFTPTPVTTYHNDNQSTGINSTETLLTPSSVNVAQFGKQFATAVDGQVYAQPLYVPNVTIPSGPQAGLHNIVYVATQHDTLYAIDARGGNVLWSRSFLDTANPLVNKLGATAITTMPQGDTGSADITVEVGITATPVISQVNGVGTIYVEAKSKQNVAGNFDHYVQTLYKIDIQTGVITGSTIIGDTRNTGGGFVHRITDTGTGTDPYVIGTGYAGEATLVGGQSRIYFNAMKQQDRPGLIIDHGTLYTAWASHGDNGPYHGWVLGFDPTTLAVKGVLNTTPNGGLGGIWQGGSVTTTDVAGNLYFETGNGDFNTAAGNFNAGFLGKPHDANYGDSFLKVSVDPTTTATSQNANGWGLKVADFFSPFNNAQLNGGDTDLGSGGDVILPDAIGSALHPHLLLGSGKEGKLYLIDRDNMGGFNPTTDKVVQEQGGAISGLLNAPAFFFNNPSPAVGNPSGSVLILMGYGGGAKAFSVSNGAFNVTPTSVTTNDFGYLPGSPSISADGLNNPILWGVNRNTNRLYAYRADNLGVELWDSSQAALNRDQLGSAVKFSVPTVADGQVFVGTSNQLVVYGPPVPPTAGPNAPSNAVASAPYFNQISLTWQDNSNNETFFRIERTTTPLDPNSWVEIGQSGANTASFTDSNVLSQTAYSYRVRAFNSFQNGTNSAYSNTSTVTTPAAPPMGTGDGLAANYFNDLNAVAADPHLTVPAVLTRTDATINFDWGGGSPGAPVPVDNFSARWLGSIQATTTGSYTFRTTSDDGVRLYLDNTLVINNWTDHAPTDDLYTVTLTGGTTHTIKMEYYENGGGAVAKLNWTVPGSATFVPVPFVEGGAAANYFDDRVAPGAHLQGAPVLSRVDATVDSNVVWTAGDPDGAGTALTGNNFSTRWTGKVQAQFTGTYTFHTISDDGVRLWVNGQLLINDWVTQGATDTYATINLSGGQKYDIRMEYFQGTGGIFAQLHWAGPATADQIIPTSQLYSGVAPAIPTNLVATPASGTQINLTWSDNSSIETGYVVERMDPGGLFTAIATLASNSTSYMDGALNPATAYSYRVKATNFAADSGYSNVVTPTTPIPPNKPTNAHATLNTTNAITLAWTDNSNNEDGFRVSRSANGGSFIVIAQLPPNSVSYADSGLTAGTDYEYHVQGYNVAGYNDFSGTQTGTLTVAPTAPGATPGAAGQISVSWTPPTYNGHVGMTFNIYRGTAANGEAVVPIATGVTASPFLDTGLLDGTKYYYKITAVDPGGESASSLETSATTIIPTPVATVINRAIFYNNSSYDGNDPTANVADDSAIATDKQALLPGQTASFSNYTSYDKGINGLIVDLANASSFGTVDATDFTFQISNDGVNWTAAPAASSITSRLTPGNAASQRIEILFADGSITNKWLRVNVHAAGHTGLAAPDVFYFGNLVGGTGQHNNVAIVNITDISITKQAVNTPATITSIVDFNRTGQVTISDVSLAKLNNQISIPLFTAPVPPPPAVVVATAFAVPVTAAAATAPVTVRPAVRKALVSVTTKTSPISVSPFATAAIAPLSNDRPSLKDILTGKKKSVDTFFGN